MYTRIFLVALLVVGLATVLGCWPPPGTKATGGSCESGCTSCVEVLLDKDCRPENSRGDYLETIEVEQGQCLCFKNTSDMEIAVNFHVLPNLRPIGDRGKAIEPGGTWCPKIENMTEDGVYSYNVKCEGGAVDGPKVKVGGGG